jgi:hypothetical protein
MSITPFDHLDIGPVFIGTFVKQNNVLENNHGGYLLRILSDRICVPYCFSLTQRIFVAQMDVSLQGSDENSTKGDHLRYSLFYFII